ncbi:zinc-ribbon domain-containing protein [Companilactobacillus huachuanensis]|uniref:Zinc-ribbon domain-containing protein n=1 Tax=Companilactobacillus huachuanensis TaxID=2559914 RepID=A0ABW1RP38_9LACO|nr:zinc-ribbon domain-containing protein [Companilactobacillus huachuanensis]
MKFCPKCGAKCKDDDHFCGTCGTKFNDEETFVKQESTQVTTEQPDSNRIRYTNGPLGFIRPEIFWPIAGIILYLISIYNGAGIVSGLVSGIIWGILVSVLRRPSGISEDKYSTITILVVVILICL